MSIKIKDPGILFSLPPSQTPITALLPLITWYGRWIIGVDIEELGPHFPPDLIGQEPSFTDRHASKGSHISGLTVQSLVDLCHFLFPFGIKVCKTEWKRALGTYLPCVPFLFRAQSSYLVWSKVDIFKVNLLMSTGFRGGASGKEPACWSKRRRRHGFDPWVGKIPWRKKWQPTLVLFSEKSNRQRSLEGYSPQDLKETWLKRLSMYTHWLAYMVCETLRRHTI